MSDELKKIVLGQCTCYNADCKSVMRSIPDNSIDFVLSDIPYEFDLQGGSPKGYFAGRKMYNDRESSSLHFISEGIDYDVVFSEFIRICRYVNIVVFCSNKQIGKIMTWFEEKGLVATLLVWDKPNPTPFGNKCYINNLEFMIYVRSQWATYNNLGYSLQLKTFHDTPPPVRLRLHETEKPVSLLEHLLLIHTNEGQTVFDGFAGSFTTALACHHLRRKFIGCELLSKYFEPAMKRLENECSQGTLF